MSIYRTTVGDITKWHRKFVYEGLNAHRISGCPGSAPSWNIGYPLAPCLPIQNAHRYTLLNPA